MNYLSLVCVTSHTQHTNTWRVKSVSVFIDSFLTVTSSLIFLFFFYSGSFSTCNFTPTGIFKIMTFKYEEGMTAIEILFLKSLHFWVITLLTGSVPLLELSGRHADSQCVYSCSVKKEGKLFWQCKAHNHICHTFSCRI